MAFRRFRTRLTYDRPTRDPGIEPSRLRTYLLSMALPFNPTDTNLVISRMLWAVHTVIVPSYSQKGHVWKLKVDPSLHLSSLTPFLSLRLLSLLDLSSPIEYTMVRTRTFFVASLTAICAAAAPFDSRHHPRGVRDYACYHLLALTRDKGCYRPVRRNTCRGGYIRRRIRGGDLVPDC
jgi:hypothetical protein